MNRRPDSKLRKGNMALDVSRIILQPTFELTTIDCQPCFDCFGEELCKESISGWKTWTSPGSLHPKDLREVLGKYFWLEDVDRSKQLAPKRAP